MSNGSLDIGGEIAKLAALAALKDQGTGPKPASEANQPARERDSERKHERQQPRRRGREFDELLLPLERIGDEYGPKRLNGWGLELCLAAFHEHPEGFAICVGRALGKWREHDPEKPVTNPLGLLVHMVREGEHEGREALYEDEHEEVL